MSEAIETIQNDMVDESMCMRLEGLFNSCAREHKDLEDVYSNVKYNDEICGYEDVLIRLRDECEDMEYCDETVKFVRAIIRNTIIIMDMFVVFFYYLFCRILISNFSHFLFLHS